MILATGDMTDPASSECPRPRECRTSWTTIQPRPIPTSNDPPPRRTALRPNPDHTSRAISASIPNDTPDRHAAACAPGSRSASGDQSSTRSATAPAGASANDTPARTDTSASAPRTSPIIPAPDAG